MDNNILLKNILDQVTENRQHTQTLGEDIAGIKKQLNNGISTNLKEIKESSHLYRERLDILEQGHTKINLKIDTHIEAEESTIHEVSEAISFIKFTSKLIGLAVAIATIVGIVYTITNGG